MRGPVQRRMPFHNLADISRDCLRAGEPVDCQSAAGVGEFDRHHKHSAGGQVHRLPRNRLMATVVPRFVLLWALLLATSPDGARGFSLPEMPADRRPAAARGLAEEEEPCSSSCDATKTNECDVASPNDPTNFEFADGASNCDLHPSTSCDRDCAPSPSPPPATRGRTAAPGPLRRRRRRRPTSPLSCSGHFSRRSRFASAAACASSSTTAGLGNTRTLARGSVIGAAAVFRASSGKPSARTRATCANTKDQNPPGRTKAVGHPLEFQCKKKYH